MFGIFQADLPIGRRLWVILLAIIVSGQIRDASTNFTTNPIDFFLNAIYFFGYVFIVSAFFSILPLLVLSGVDVYRTAKNEAKDPYREAVKSKNLSVWKDSIFNLAFIITTFVAIPNFGKSSLIASGTLGLAIILLTEVFDLDLLFPSKTEILELKSQQENKMQVMLHDGELINT